MKALTLHQPWAQLVALGVKTIETRSWSTRYRGPLAIHTGVRLPDVGMRVGDYRVHHARGPKDAPWELWATARHLRHQRPVPAIPFGAVVATCELVDVVPMYGRRPKAREHCLVLQELPFVSLSLTRLDRPPQGVTDQRPYGDFAPGRFAWLLADVEPLDEPIPATGHQGLWEWTR